MMDLDNSANHRWDERGSVVWSYVRYPDDVAELLLSNELLGDDDDDEADLIERGVSENGFHEEIIDICDA